MTCFPDEVNWNNKEFTKEMLDYLRAVYCVHPMVLDALDYINSLESRIAELEKDNDEFRQMIHDWIIILTPDDGYVPDSECNDVATPIDVALRKRIAELEGKIDQLTAHDATERQDDNRKERE